MAQGLPAEAAQQLAEVSDKLHDLFMSTDGPLDPSVLASFGCEEVGPADLDLERALEEVMKETDEDLFPASFFETEEPPTPAHVKIVALSPLDTMLRSAIAGSSAGVAATEQAQPVQPPVVAVPAVQPPVVAAPAVQAQPVQPQVVAEPLQPTPTPAVAPSTTPQTRKRTTPPSPIVDGDMTSPTTAVADPFAQLLADLIGSGGTPQLPDVSMVDA